MLCGAQNAKEVGNPADQEFWGLDKESTGFEISPSLFSTARTRSTNLLHSIDFLKLILQVTVLFSACEAGYNFTYLYSTILDVQGLMCCNGRYMYDSLVHDPEESSRKRGRNEQCTNLTQLGLGDVAGTLLRQRLLQGSSETVLVLGRWSTYHSYLLMYGVYHDLGRTLERFVLSYTH